MQGLRFMPLQIVATSHFLHFFLIDLNKKHPPKPHKHATKRIVKLSYHSTSRIADPLCENTREKLKH